MVHLEYPMPGGLPSVRAGPPGSKPLARGRSANPRGQCAARIWHSASNPQRLGPASRSGPRVGGLITSRDRAVSRRQMSRNTRSSLSLARRAARFAASRWRSPRSAARLADARLRPVRIAAAVPFRTARTTSSRPPSTAPPTRSYSFLALLMAFRQAARARSSAACPASPTAPPRPALPRSPAARSSERPSRFSRESARSPRSRSPIRPPS